jgi:hypothetical protein
MMKIELPRSFANQMSVISSQLTDRMHELLERNTDGALTEPEKQELEAIVNLAHMSEFFSMACDAATHP